MNIKPFAVEEWMNAYEDGARYNIAETCVDSVSLDELFSLAGEDKQAFLERFCAREFAGSIKVSDRTRSFRRTAQRARIITCSARSSPRETAW